MLNNTLEAPSMDRTTSILLNVFSMSFGCITLVFNESILRKEEMVFGHFAIPDDLCHDGGSCNRLTLRIPLDDWKLPSLCVDPMVAIDQNAVDLHL